MNALRQIADGMRLQQRPRYGGSWVSEHVDAPGPNLAVYPNPTEGAYPLLALTLRWPGEPVPE